MKLFISLFIMLKAPIFTNITWIIFELWNQAKLWNW